MKFSSVYVTAICLAGLGLSAPAPVKNERGIMMPVDGPLPKPVATPVSVDADDNALEKRRKGPKPPPSNPKPPPSDPKPPPSDPKPPPSDPKPPPSTPKAPSTPKPPSTPTPKPKPTTSSKKSSTAKTTSTKPKPSSTLSTSRTARSTGTSGKATATATATGRIPRTSTGPATGKTTGTATDKTTGTATGKTTGTTTGKTAGTTTGKTTGTTTGTSTRTTTTGAACVRPTGARASSKPRTNSPRADKNPDTQGAAGASCEQEQYIDFGNGWRTPTKDEQKAAKVETAPLAPGFTYRTMLDDFPKPDKVTYSNGKKGLPKVDCPSDGQDVISKGKMDNPPENSALFYSVVGGDEKNWAQKSGKGFRFMLDMIKDDAKDWVIQNYGCPRIWPWLSVAAALQSKGDVHVLLPSRDFKVGEKPKWPKPNKPNAKENQNSVWEDYEWPALLRDNEGACRVWRWIHKGGQPDLIAVRTDGSCSPKYPKTPAGDATKKTWNWTTKTLT